MKMKVFHSAYTAWAMDDGSYGVRRIQYVGPAFLGGWIDWERVEDICTGLGTAVEAVVEANRYRLNGEGDGRAALPMGLTAADITEMAPRLQEVLERIATTWNGPHQKDMDVRVTYFAEVLRLLSYAHHTHYGFWTATEGGLAALARGEFGEPLPTLDGVLRVISLKGKPAAKEEELT